VVATGAGVVKSVGASVGYGNVVDVDHGMGISSRYAHMKSFIVAPNERVVAGQVLGYQGSTGSRVTGEHLHYEVRSNNKAVDPYRFVHVIDRPQHKFVFNVSNTKYAAG